MTGEHPVPGQDPLFSVFGLAPAFSIDVASIRSQWISLSREFHPDRLSGTTERMSQINEAYQVLSDPESRRAYILDQVIGGAHRAICGRLKTQIPLELAGEWFEIQELFEEGKSETAQARLGVFRSEVEARIQELLSQRADHESQWDLTRSPDVGSQLITLRGELTTLESLVRDVRARSR